MGVSGSLHPTRRKSKPAVIKMMAMRLLPRSSVKPIAAGELALRRFQSVSR